MIEDLLTIIFMSIAIVSLIIITGFISINIFIYKIDGVFYNYTKTKPAKWTRDKIIRPLIDLIIDLMESKLPSFLFAGQDPMNIVFVLIPIFLIIMPVLVILYTLILLPILRIRYITYIRPQEILQQLANIGEK